MIEIWFDGACEPKNPGGTASYGYIIVIRDSPAYELGAKLVIRRGGIVGSGHGMSNNVAEYEGLIQALNDIMERKRTEDTILVRGDSMLVINQMGGDWKIKKGFYVERAQKCLKIVTRFPRIRFEWIPRTQNWGADKLSKEALIGAGVKFRIQADFEKGRR